jgi:DNA-binding transcriptional LysR family regulator
MIDWNDYRFFLAVAETGRLSAAARRLKVSQPTVGRRLAELEGRLGARLFDRLPDGFRLTLAGERILDLARRMAEDARAIEHRVAGEDEQLHGSVLLATPEGLGTYWLAPRLEWLRSRHPRIDLELVVGTGALDLLRREADVALRIGPPGADDVVGRRLGCIRCGRFAAQGYLERHGAPERLEDLSQHRIIESVREIAQLRQAELLREAAVRARGTALQQHLEPARRRARRPRHHGGAAYMLATPPTSTRMAMAKASSSPRKASTAAPAGCRPAISTPPSTTGATRSPMLW